MRKQLRILYFRYQRIKYGMWAIDLNNDYYSGKVSFETYQIVDRWIRLKIVKYSHEKAIS